MAKPDKLWKTTIVIWSDTDPYQRLDLRQLVEDAISGDSYLGDNEMELVTDPAQFPDTEFFGGADGEEDHI